MLEVLVFWSCINGVACGETSGAYYLYHPEVKERMLYFEDQAKRIAGEQIITYGTPLLMIASGAEGSVKINKYFSIKGKNKWANTELYYSYSF